MSLRLITTHIEVKNGIHLLPRKSNLYDCEFTSSQLKLFLTMDDKDGFDEFEFKFIRPNQFIDVLIDEFAYLGKGKDEQGDILVFFKIIMQHK